MGKINIEDIKKCQMCSGEFLTESGVVSIRVIRKSFTLRKKYVCEECCPQWVKAEERLQNVMALGASFFSIIVATLFYVVNHKAESLLFLFVGSTGVILFSNRLSQEKQKTDKIK